MALGSDPAGRRCSWSTNSNSELGAPAHREADEGALVLRPFEMDDAAFVHECSDPHDMRFGALCEIPSIEDAERCIVSSRGDIVLALYSYGRMKSWPNMAMAQMDRELERRPVRCRSGPWATASRPV